MLVLSLLEYFTDPVLRAPTIGCMLMCLGASLVGVIVFLRKQSLVGESLSHAAYPGVILGVIAITPFLTDESPSLPIALSILIGAFLTALFGLWCIERLEKKLRIRSDAALCFVLSAFFGVGLTLASRIQLTHTKLYIQVQSYLYGQAATMTDVHIVIYGCLAALILTAVLLLYKELQVMNFDRDYAASLGIPARSIDSIVFFLVVLAVVVGIRSVGVVLMSAMLIAPAVAARQFTNRLSIMLFLAGIFGILSGFLGNVLSVELSKDFADRFPGTRLALPTGPMIVLVASVICVLSLLFAPVRGLCPRLVRIAAFRYRCVYENILKLMWRRGAEKAIALDHIAKFEGMPRMPLRFILHRLKKNGWITILTDKKYQLTSSGQQKAANIVRLHRLWELYLADCLGMGVERVHRSAEEMEHIITPELEERLTQLLHDPKQDPHQQPIPPKEVLE